LPLRPLWRGHVVAWTPDLTLWRGLPTTPLAPTEGLTLWRGLPTMPQRDCHNATEGGMVKRPCHNSGYATTAGDGRHGRETMPQQISPPATNHPPPLLDHFLERLEGEGLDDRPRRLGLDLDRLAGERVAAHARLGGRLVDALDFHQPGRNRDHARSLLAQLVLDQVVEGVEDGGYLLAG